MSTRASIAHEIGEEGIYLHIFKDLAEPPDKVFCEFRDRDVLLSFAIPEATWKSIAGQIAQWIARQQERK